MGQKSNRPDAEFQKPAKPESAAGSAKAEDASKSSKGNDIEKRMRKRDEERARRRERRRKKVRRQKITIAVSACMIVAAAAVIVVLTTPAMKLSRSLSRGDKYAAEEDYLNAQGAYEEALEIDPLSVKAYRGIADTYLAQGKMDETEQILYAGWEQTQDESLLHYYCVEVYNEAVAEINGGNCTFDTVDKCIQVLELEPDNENAIETLRTYCYEKVFDVMGEDDTCMMFFDEDLSHDTCSYMEYERMVKSILALYQTSKTEEIKEILIEYALIDKPYLWISMPHLEQYTALLTEINTGIGDTGIAETLACLTRAREVEDYFADAFVEFESDNYAYARDLVSEDSYQQIRDDFINEDSGCWEGSIYIPVNRELLVLHREEGTVRFYYPGEEEYENHQGIITVWGVKQEDDGVQRSVISYEPASQTALDSHVEYTIQYLYSNVKIGGQYVPQMNYRFDTKLTTGEGITTNAIGDWGGEHEWEIDY